MLFLSVSSVDCLVFCFVGFFFRVLHRMVKKTLWSSDLSTMIQAHGNG